MPAPRSLRPSQDSPLAKRIGQRISRARRRRGWTQMQLADRIGSGRSYVARMEIGRHAPSLMMLVSLAKVLRIKVRDFVR